VRPALLALALMSAACRSDPDCRRAVEHGMDLADAELRRTLADEAPDWRDRALAESKRVREEAIGRCKQGSLDEKSYACTMAAKTYQALLDCPGWK